MMTFQQSMIKEMDLVIISCARDTSVGLNAAFARLWKIESDLCIQAIKLFRKTKRAMRETELALEMVMKES